MCRAFYFQENAQVEAPHLQIINIALRINIARKLQRGIPTHFQYLNARHGFPSQEFTKEEAHKFLRYSMMGEVSHTKHFAGKGQPEVEGRVRFKI
jgi:hypothetical protein